MKLSNENVNATRNKIDRDIRMLECIENIHKKMEYEISCEDPNVSYISIDGLRLIFENGVYKGWYVFEEETEEYTPKMSDETIDNINTLRKLVKSFFCEFLPPVDVDICEYNSDWFPYTRITIHRDEYLNCNKSIVITGSIDHLASLPKDEFYYILNRCLWFH